MADAVFTEVSLDDLQWCHLKKWWHDDLTDEAIKLKYKNRIGDKAVVSFIIYLNAHAIGFIQYYHASAVGEGWWPDEIAGTVGIDQLIGEENYINRGLGTLIIKKFVNYLLDNPAIKKIIVDVDPVNLRAKRCYEKVGFKSVKQCITPEGLVDLMEINNE